MVELLVYQTYRDLMKSLVLLILKIAIAYDASLRKTLNIKANLYDFAPPYQ